MLDVRANTQVIVPIGPFVDVTDGFTPETGITLGAADEAELLKHGSTSVVDISAATWAAITSMDGHYALTLTTSHTDTEGQLTVVVQDDSVCLPVRMHFRVLSEAAYDSLYVAKDDGFMDVNIKTIGRADTQETEASNLEAAAAAYSATRGLAGTALPAAAADAAGGLPISDAGGLDLDAKLANTNEVTAARMSELDAGTGGKMAAEVDLIKGYTDDIGTAGAGLTALGDARIANLDAAVTTRASQTSVDDLPTNAELATSQAAADDATLAAIAALNNLSAAQVNAEADTAIADAALATAANLATAQTAIDAIPTNAELATALASADDAVLAAIAALNNLSAAQVNAEMVDVLRTDTGTEVSAVPAAAAAIAAQIQFLFQALRNKVTVSATAKTISNDAGTTVGTKTLSDDGTTYQEGEMA